MCVFEASAQFSCARRKTFKLLPLFPRGAICFPAEKTLLSWALGGDFRIGMPLQFAATCAIDRQGMEFNIAEETAWPNEPILHPGAALPRRRNF
ncbi:MAG TPA: hypothetical protein VM468_02815 [Mycoplana sp.]|nr:hypothetical protein [Mycoplana sp.]